MKIIDMHCDTASKILDSRETLAKNSCMIDIERMSEYERYIQFFAVYADPKFSDNPFARFKAVADKFFCEMQNDNIVFCKTFEEAKNSKTAAFLSVEGADFVKSTEDIYMLYDMGVRCIGLTWNYSNSLASGVLNTNTGYGLTPLGRDVIRTMNKLGILLDVSHMSDKAFFEAAEVSEKPFFATHSNLRSVCPNVRNLTDEQFKIICQSGGGVGINLYAPFVSEGGNELDDMKRHIEKMINLGGENSIGLGCDFDGADNFSFKIDSCSDIKDVLFENLKCFIGETVIFKIFYGNFECILHDNI